MAKVMKSSEIESEYGLPAELLNKWAKDANEGVLHDEVRETILSGQAEAGEGDVSKRIGVAEGLEIDYDAFDAIQLEVSDADDSKVVLPRDEYERLKERAALANLYAKLLIAEREEAEGKTIRYEEFREEIRNRYGI